MATILTSGQSQLVSSDEESVQERILPAVGALVARAAAILGPRVYLFVTCMGVNFTLECGQKMVDCSVRGNLPWECIGGLVCSGKSAYQCVRTAG